MSPVATVVRYGSSFIRGDAELVELDEAEARKAHDSGQRYVVLREVDGRPDAVATLAPRDRIELRVLDPEDPTRERLLYVIGKPPGHNIEGVFVERLQYKPTPESLVWVIRLSPDGTARVSGGSDLPRETSANVTQASLTWPDFGHYDELFSLPRDVTAFLLL